MSTNKQTQKSGDYSPQTQIGTLNIGVDEKRVREVFNEMISVALKDFSIEAQEVGIQRSHIFEEILLEKMIRTNTLEALKDPAIQLQLVEAQKIAISTDKEQDYDMLSELMIQRFKSGDDRHKITGISKAIEAVDKLSDESLQGLTLLFAITRYLPISNDLITALERLDSLYADLIYSSLPTGEDWVDSLDIHSAVRISSVGSMLNFEDFWYQQLDGCLKRGILIDSEDYVTSVDKLSTVGLMKSVLVKSADSLYVKLPIVNKDAIKDLKTNQNGMFIELDEKQISVLEEIYDLYEEADKSKEEFSILMAKYPSISTARDWWSQNITNYSFKITTVGIALAQTNSLRIDSSLPKVVNE